MQPSIQSLSLAERIATLPPKERERVIGQMTDKDALELQFTWEFWARPSQLAPIGDWVVWLIMTGRGWGKSRTGAETVRGWVETGKCGHLALIGRTAADGRDVMVEGNSGLLKISPPWFRPKYEPSKRRLTWPNGAVATVYSADEPDLLRGPEHDGAWGDEIAAWRFAEEAWSNLIFGLRIGKNPQIIGTTTPKPTKFMRELLADPTTVVTGGKTSENIHNLADVFLRKVVAKYKGTTLGLQELDGRMLEDVKGALWKRSQIDHVRNHPPLVRIVVAIDPPTTSNDGSDEAGIVVCGKDADGHGYLLEDVSAVLSPSSWASAAVKELERWEGDRIVAEVNNGGDMVELTVRSIRSTVPYKSVWASRGKRTRAEPVAALHEQGKIHHVGHFAELEDELCTHDFSEGKPSPNRLDAYVWAFTDLLLGPQHDGIGASSGKRRSMVA
jgi:phage terminase large subunit-like protein